MRNDIFSELLALFELLFESRKNNNYEYSHTRTILERICLSKHSNIGMFFLKACIKPVGLASPNNIFLRLEGNRISATRLNVFTSLNCRFYLVWSNGNEQSEIQMYLEPMIHQIYDLTAFLNVNGREDNRQAFQATLLKSFGIISAACLSTDHFGRKIASFSIFGKEGYGSSGHSITRCVHL